MKPNSRRGGFTLPELLVVMGIISILLVIALSVARAVRQSANRTVCVSNLRQIGMLIHSYAADNGGEIPAVYGQGEQGALRPMAWVNTAVFDHAKGIAGVLLLVSRPIGMASGGYILDANFFLCPTDDTAPYGRDGVGGFASGGPIIRRMSYAYCYVPSSGDSYPWWNYSPTTGKSWNGGTPPIWTSGALAGFSRHSLNRGHPASTAVMFEPHVFHRTDMPRLSFHSNGGNVLYLDGHVVDLIQHELAPPDGTFNPLKERLSILDQ